MIDRQNIESEFKNLQDRICKGLENLDGLGRFRQDLWHREKGGGGRTRIIQSQHIEKGGVNFSAVMGDMPERISKALGLGPNRFFATGVSIVLHARNPHVPIIHMNVRYFETSEGPWWFGGGIDMTPHYIIDKDAAQFHRSLKETCDKYDHAWYPEFKKWADDYFYLKHRNETRGIGGIFFDRMDSKRASKDRLFDFVIDVGDSFLDCYSEVFNKYSDKAYTEREKEWQLHRRGRYVEFNLVWDKGTRFGLDTGGNIESILMSLPPECRWTYSYDYNKIELDTLNKLKKEIDWLSRTAE